LESPGPDPAVGRRVGVFGPNSINALKRYLFLEGKLPTPWSEIETVILDDLQHYLSLLADSSGEATVKSN
jgi:hypothetical protein